MKKIVLAAQIAALAVAGCSTASKDIVPQQVSPQQYSNYDCDQIAAEQLRLHQRFSQLGGRLDQAAANDQAIGWVGGLLFWPALFWLGGTKEQEAEYGRLRGEYDALQQAAILKKCPASMAPSQQAAPDGVVNPDGSSSTPGRAILTPTSAPASEGK
ncbi:MAG TPA: hypothetical protein VIV54_03700 [Burkholderiales bacterium]